MDSTSDESLRKILKHNRDEEIEHAVMAIEWLRRNMEGWDENLRNFLFTEGEIAGSEDSDEMQDYSGEPGTDLGIGKIK
ncbi:MAG: hypothetical protein RQ761_09245 [Bacteroidales bacterium]|nr:hypothetical protein [Bacteroidales bacterium]